MSRIGAKAQREKRAETLAARRLLRDLKIPVVERVDSIPPPVSLEEAITLETDAWSTLGASAALLAFAIFVGYVLVATLNGCP